MLAGLLELLRAIPLIASLIEGASNFIDKIVRRNRQDVRDKAIDTAANTKDTSAIEKNLSGKE